MKSYTVDGQYNAVNLGLWSRVTPWASIEDDLEFAKPGKYSSQDGQAKSPRVVRIEFFLNSTSGTS